MSCDEKLAREETEAKATVALRKARSDITRAMLVLSSLLIFSVRLPDTWREEGAHGEYMEVLK